ncbi:hypothetical protein [Picrophilus oshimae]|uniref:Uncharacterized protein n=1 Tax=Picrophilus torridus (strain ATCC 700027 / DSM 9790 / JCM 10055 / NBRC 100828 / KAW 2/3) TaxID=1122961 RepID=A0A8G2L7C3_PICTO|nr:hypothetical protein [Picrophilus oshimae]SMD30180.1 hypothetical protein SAMN02745355_0042 [Picrophilus oshimae DSM 9789]
MTVFCPDGRINETINKLKKIDFLNQRYLVYRQFYSGFSMKLIADTKSEVDDIIKISSKTLDNFMLMTNFNAYFNRDLKWCL